jgi:four helix bundle protein
MILHFFEAMPLLPKAHAFVLEIYRVTQQLPRHEAFGLMAQLRRAAVSIPANICEGKGHNNDREMNRYVNIARASLSEVCYYLMLSRDLQYISPADFDRLYAQAEEIGRMTAGLQKYMKEHAVAKKNTVRR